MEILTVPIKLLFVLTISINHIISSHRGGGYNLASLKNLRQNQAEKVETLGIVETSKASKYRKILTNWFICNEKERQTGEIKQRRQTTRGLPKRSGDSEFIVCSSKDSPLNSFPPSSASPMRWRKYIFSGDWG